MAETTNGHVANIGRRILISLLGIAVVAIFGTAIFSYQVQSTERAVVLTFGSISGVRDPGLHFRWTLHMQKIVKYDMRLRSVSYNHLTLPTTDLVESLDAH